MEKKNVTLQIEPELEERANELFISLGMDLSTATAVFYHQALRCNGIPFEIKSEEPNEETKEAIEEVKRMKADPSLGKTYTDVDEMMRL